MAVVELYSRFWVSTWSEGAVAVAASSAACFEMLDIDDDYYLDGVLLLPSLYLELQSLTFPRVFEVDVWFTEHEVLEFGGYRILDRWLCPGVGPRETFR